MSPYALPRRLFDKALLASVALHTAGLAIVLPHARMTPPPAPQMLSVTLVQPPRPAVTPVASRPETAAAPRSSPTPRQPDVRPAAPPAPIVQAAPARIAEASATPAVTHAPAPVQAAAPAPTAAVAPPPVAAAPADENPDPRALDGYGNALSAEFARHQSYPRIAQLRRWQGLVQLRLRVAKKGTVLEVTVTQSSGYDVLDRQAIEMVKGAPLPRPPESLQGREFSVVVPIVFRLENS